MLVLERRERLGGACTLEQPFADPGYVVSPCAYVVGLLDQRVIDELALRRHGYKVFVAEPAIWCPFDDGTWYAQFLDPERTAAGMRENGFSEADIEGQFAYEDFFDRMRQALREGARDTWVGESPVRGRAARAARPRPGDDRGAVRDVDRRRHRPLRRPTPGCSRRSYGQGVIGAWAGPRTPGTASIKLMHFQGTLEGVPMAWGYVEGGMGRISFAIGEAAREAGAVLAAGVPVAEILPGEGVVLEGGEMIRARAVVSNADPKVTGRLLGDAVDAGVRRRGSATWRTTQPGRQGQLRPVPAARGGPRCPTTTGRTGRRCRSPCRWTTPSRRSRTARAASRPRASPSCTSRPPTTRPWRPPGKHTMSAFVQYAPYELADGTWDERRDEIGQRVLGLIGRYCDIDDVVEHVEVLGPPDIEQRVGLTGGHIFQGECTPDQMWSAPDAPARARRRRLPLRRGHPPGRQRHRPQRPQRGDGRARRPRRLTAERRSAGRST